MVLRLGGWFTSDGSVLQNVTQQLRPDKDKTKMDIKVIGHFGVSWSNVAQDWDRCRVMNL
jgi:hypothetical protein